MSSDLAISVRGLSKEFTIAHEEKNSTLSEKIIKRLKHPMRKPKKETFRALQEVSFDVKKGEVMGIIGRNGAGKSTLLKLLSRITEPTSGEIQLFGRVASLLEVGTGFHSELTGRENIFLNGAILGMTRAEIRKHFDEIVAFAEVERFLDTPVKRYSSGMYVRLAFAVAAHLNPEILIVDEVLSVGDADFQKKCLGKMQQVSRESDRTVLFVSHNMTLVQALCNRAILLRGGKVVMDDDILPVIENFQASSEGQTVVLGRPLSLVDAKRWGGNGRARLISATPFQPGASDPKDTIYRQGDLGFRLAFSGDVTSIGAAGIQVSDQYERKIVNINTLERQDRINLRPGNALTLIIRGMRLRPGVYKVGFWIGGGEEQHIDVITDHCLLEVLQPIGRKWTSKHDGIVEYDFDYSVDNNNAIAAECN